MGAVYSKRWLISHKNMEKEDFYLPLDYAAPKRLSSIPPFMQVFCVIFALFFLLVTEKDDQTCFNAETNDFDQQTACRANLSLVEIHNTWLRLELIYF